MNDIIERDFNMNMYIIRGIITLDGKSLVSTKNAGYVYGFRRKPSMIHAVTNMDLRARIQATFGILRNSEAMPWLGTVQDHITWIWPEVRP